MLVLGELVLIFCLVETCQAMAERNPWIHWREIPDASHYGHEDNLEAYAAELGAFLVLTDPS